MTYYRFVSTDGRRRALAPDKQGGRLPATLSGWNFLGPMHLAENDTRFGASVADITASVERNGYFLLPDQQLPLSA